MFCGQSLLCKFTSSAEIHGFLNMQIPLKSYLHSLILNDFCLLTGSFFFFFVVLLYYDPLLMTGFISPNLLSNVRLLHFVDTLLAQYLKLHLLPKQKKKDFQSAAMIVSLPTSGSVTCCVSVHT